MPDTPIAVDDIFRVRVYSYFPAVSQVGINLLEYVCTDIDAPGGTLEDMADALEIAIGTRWKALMSDQSRFSGISIYRVWPTRSLTYKAVASAGTGASAGTPIPTEMAAILQKDTERAGRRRYGRIFFPFIVHGALDVTNGELTGAFVTALQDGPGLIIPAVTPHGVSDRFYTLQGVIVDDDAIGTYGAIEAVRAPRTLGGLHKRGQYGKLNREGP